MSVLDHTHGAIWGIAALATSGVIIRPWHFPEAVWAVLGAAAPVGVDLGPNLSVTGSLATILWLVALRREGQHVGAWKFLRLGIVVMPPAFLLALGGLVLLR